MLAMWRSEPRDPFAGGGRVEDRCLQPIACLGNNQKWQPNQTFPGFCCVPARTVKNKLSKLLLLAGNYPDGVQLLLKRESLSRLLEFQHDQFDTHANRGHVKESLADAFSARYKLFPWSGARHCVATCGCTKHWSVSGLKLLTTQLPGNCITICKDTWGSQGGRLVDKLWVFGFGVQVLCFEDFRAQFLSSLGCLCVKVRNAVGCRKQLWIGELKREHPPAILTAGSLSCPGDASCMRSPNQQKQAPCQSCQMRGFGFWFNGMLFCAAHCITFILARAIPRDGATASFRRILTVWQNAHTGVRS